MAMVDREDNDENRSFMLFIAEVVQLSYVFMKKRIV